MSKNPIIVAIEGHDGAGKSMCLKHLVESLRSDGKSVSSFEFHDRPYSKAIVKNVTEAGLLNSVAISIGMAISFMSTVEQALSSGSDYVIFHRYKYTGLLKDHLLNIPNEVSSANYSLAQDADVLIYLDVSPEVALERIMKKRRVSFYETTMLYTEGPELAEHRRRYSLGEYSEEVLGQSFLKLKGREEVFWQNQVCTRPECKIVSADASPHNVSNQVVSLIRRIYS